LICKMNKRCIISRKDTSPITVSNSRRFKRDIEQLTKQMQQMSLNYTTIALALLA
ncbi:13590_t:CDS:2, partial [Gigaspora margarita]